jgi:excisionase family DNA binding protein
MHVQEVKRETLTVEETASVLGVSRGTTYAQINAGAIRSIRLGKRLLVPRAEIDRLLAGEPARR